jgi:uncharacterized protein YxjI
MKQRNIVKKHTFSFNKPKIELDRKKEMRKNGHTDEQEARYQLMLEEEE